MQRQERTPVDADGQRQARDYGKPLAAVRYVVGDALLMAIETSRSVLQFNSGRRARLASQVHAVHGFIQNSRKHFMSVKAHCRDPTRLVAPSSVDVE